MVELPAISAGVASLVISLTISATLTPLVRRWALRRDFVDYPGDKVERKNHKHPKPFGGGIAITVAILLPVALILLAASGFDPDRFNFLTTWAPNWPHWMGGVAQKTPTALAVIAGALVMHLLGIIDDHRPLSAVLKLIVQLGVALLLTAYVGIRIAEALGPVPAIILSTLWIVTLTNAFNFMDNMDGLSAGVAGLTAIVLAISSLLAGQVFVPCIFLLVAGAVIGFLIYNFPPASIFMGDAGSLVIGYLLAVGAMLTTYYDPGQQRTPFGVFVPLVVFAIPLYDLVSVIIHRYRCGVSFFKGDRRHFSHRLVRLGLSPTSAVLTVYLATMATALPAILLPLLNWSEAILVFGQCICVVAIIAILESRNGR